MASLTLDWLDFDYSEDAQGHGSFDAMADITVHLLAAAPNRSFLEVHGFGLDRFIESPMKIEDGKAIASNAPGHGVAFNRAALEPYRRR
ncbi:MAG: hypothetical protein ACYC0T_17645 [Ramlibacter sp.]